MKWKVATINQTIPNPTCICSKTYGISIFNSKLYTKAIKTPIVPATINDNNNSKFHILR